MHILQLQDVEKTYGERENQVKALRKVSLQVEEGEFLAIVGTSGSGKSTLLNLMGGLDNPTKGEIFIKNREIGALSRKELTIFRRRNIGFVFQNYSLMPVLNVYDNVALPVTFDRGKHLNRAYLETLLRELGIWEKRKKYPNELSGGQQQRVGVARALVVKPEIIFADEPTGNLDSNTSKEIMNLMQNVVREQKQTLIMVTHDNTLASFADKIIRIVDGKIVDMVDNTKNEAEE